MPDQNETIRFFSHLTNSQNKWQKRMEAFPRHSEMDWWELVYKLDDPAPRWNESLQRSLDCMETIFENVVSPEKRFIGYDVAHWSIPLRDIALKLNYHSIPFANKGLNLILWITSE